MFQLFENMFYLSLFVLFGFYISYYLICYIYKAKNVKKSNAQVYEKMEFPKVSLIIPVFNENEVIKDKVRNLQELVYPRDKLEILFVDGGSTDGTDKTIKNIMNRVDLDIKLIEQGKRMGFNSAVMVGFRGSTGDVILIPGAETMYAPDALKRVILHFSDKRVGAVNGRQVLKNLDEGLSPKHEHAYRSMQDFLREGEDNMDTLFDVKGEIVAGRRTVCEELVKNPEFRGKGCIDACFFFQSRMDGYSTIYEPDAVYYESSPRSFKDSFKQRLRRAATLIQNMFIFKNMIFNRKHGSFGMLIMPAHFLMLIVLPYIFFFSLFSFLILNFIYFPNYIYLLLLALGLSLFSLSKTLQAFVKLQLVLIMAHAKLVMGVETQKFEKIESTRTGAEIKS